MPAYITRWPDKSITYTVAANKRAALAQLETMRGSLVELAQTYRLSHCSLHFTPTDDPQLFMLQMMFEEGADYITVFSHLSEGSIQ